MFTSKWIGDRRGGQIYILAVFAIREPSLLAKQIVKYLDRSAPSARHWLSPRRRAYILPEVESMRPCRRSVLVVTSGMESQGFSYSWRRWCRSQVSWVRHPHNPMDCSKDVFDGMLNSPERGLVCSVGRVELDELGQRCWVKKQRVRETQCSLDGLESKLMQRGCFLLQPWSFVCNVLTAI